MMRIEALPGSEARKDKSGKTMVEKTVTFSVPSLMPGEPPANDAQIAEMRRLGIVATDEQLQEMGTLQAKAAIERLQQEQLQVLEQLRRSELQKNLINLAWFIFFIVMLMRFIQNL